MRKMTRGMGYWAPGMCPGGVKGGRLCCSASHSTLSKAMYGRRMWRSCQRCLIIASTNSPPKL
ncbi:hypothetical protein EYF80_022648 [Liparis tanakae]|uniref:Uncharacterized protein n=1 Tax=Liparis tanakae TaxID=230148 RepID=A0A4Z2HMP3_9TELE|nr:hypothetical protein EYF80_022648 [Liparis tanakae]